MSIEQVTPATAPHANPFGDFFVDQMHQHHHLQTKTAHHVLPFHVWLMDRGVRKFDPDVMHRADDGYREVVVHRNGSLLKIRIAPDIEDLRALENLNGLGLDRWISDFERGREMADILHDVDITILRGPSGGERRVPKRVHTVQIDRITTHTTPDVSLLTGAHVVLIANGYRRDKRQYATTIDISKED